MQKVQAVSSRVWNSACKSVKNSSQTNKKRIKLTKNPNDGAGAQGAR